MDTKNQPSPSSAIDEMTSPPVDVSPPALTADQQARAAQDKIFASFSYLSVLFLIPLFVRRASTFCQYHARQGLGLSIVWFVIFQLGWTRFFGTGTAAFIKSFQGIGLAVFIVIGEVAVWQGAMRPLPLFGKTVERIFQWVRRKNS